MHAFWIGGNATVIYDPHKPNDIVIHEVFKGDIELAESQLSSFFLPSVVYTQPVLAPLPRLNARYITTDYVYDRVTGELLLGCTAATHGLRAHLLCFSNRLGNFIITHVDHRRNDGVRFAYIQCLEDTLQFAYHSFQRIAIANEHLELFVGMEPDERVTPHPKRWMKVSAKHDADLDKLFMEKRVKIT